MILRNRLNQLEQERTGIDLSTNSLFSDYVPQSKIGNESLSTFNQSGSSMFSDYVPQKSITPAKVEEKQVIPEKKSTFAGFGKAVLGSVPKAAIEYAAAGVDYLIKAGEDIRTGVTKQLPAMFQDIVYNKSDDPEIQKIINKYESLEKEADKLPFAQRQVEKIKLNVERARETTKYQHIGEIESALGLGGQYRTQNTERYQNIINKLSQYQDLENAGGASQLVAGLIGSTPYTAGGAVPFGVGFLLNFGVQSQNNIRQKYDELKQRGGTLTAKDADNIYLYSSGSAYVDGIVEQMTGFGVSKLYGKIFGDAAKMPVKTAFGYVVKEMAKSGGGEALEEYISGMGQAVLAKITTDPNGTILTLTEEEGGLASLEGLTKNAAGAFIIGSLMETVNTRTHLNTWNSTKAALDKIENKNFNELDMNDFDLVTNAVKEDSKDQNNMDSLELDLSEVLESTLESEGIIDSQISEDQFVSMFSDYKPEAQAQATVPVQAPRTVVEPVAPVQTENIPTAPTQAQNILVEPTVATVETIPTKVEKSSVTNADGTYNIPALEESARRLNIAMSNAVNRGQRNKMNEKLKGIYNLIEYVKENPAYQKPDIKKMVQEQRDYVASKQVEDKIDLSKAEVISDKTSTGTIYRIGDKVYKNATFKDGKTKTKEADVYEKLSGSDVVAPGKLVSIDGKDYIETPYYDIIISVDTVPKGEREKYQQFIMDNADRINQSVMELTNTGYRYSDPLQFGYKDGKMYLMDFSNAEIPQGLDKNQLLGDNYNYLSNFYKDFGLERLSKIISRSMEIKGNMESTDYDDAKARKDGFIFVPKALQDTIYDLKMQYGDKSPNNVYYVTNQRGVQIGDIAQTDSIDGIKYVYSENPIPVAKAKDYELHVLYEGQVQRRPISSAKREAKTPNTDNITAKSAETTQKQATKAEKKIYTAEQLNTAKAKLLKRLQNPLNDADKGDIQNKIARIDKLIAKQEKSVLVAESQKQDTSGTQGIVTQQYAKMMNNQPNEPAWKKTISAETKQAIDKASKPNADQSFLTMFKEKLSKLHENVTLGSVPIDVAKGDIRRLFREARAASQYAKGQAENIISKSYNKAGKDKYDLLRHSIIYLDISEDLQAGLYDSGSAMMFNIKSPEEALKTIVAIKAELAKPENTLVREALDTRRKLMDEVRDEVIAEGAKAGIDLKHIKAKANYMYHAVTEFRDEFNAALKAKGTRRGNSRVEYIARVGSARDYISDPMMADYLVLQKMQRDLARLRLYNEIKTEDISKTMPYTEEKDWAIKPGYSELDPSMLGIAEYDKFSKQQAKAIASANLQARGIDPHSDTGKRAMAKIMTKYNNHVMIVPTQIVDAVVNEFANKETSSGKMFKKLMNVWKYMKIKMPNAVWKYNTRNLFGDLDPVVSAKPNALLKIPRALKELYAFFYKGGVLTEDLQDYIKRGGVTTGQTPQELKTFNTSKLIKVYDESTKTADVAKKAIRKIWSALTLETATQYREQVMRYATYLSYASDLAKSESGLPKYYAASIPAEIQGLKDIKDRAYKLANDLVGAYDDVSIAGQWASDHLMPFFRFKEINVKRNYRMIKNAFYNDGFTVKNTAQQATNKLGNIAKASTFTVFRLTKLLLGTAAFYGALALGNDLFAGDDEDELPEDVKNSPHITIPRWITGGEKVYYIDRLGSFAEFMNMFGIDYSMGQDLNDIATGRMQLSDKIKEMASAPLLDAFNSSWPIAKIAFELVTGKTYFPDPKNPATIRDTWEYIFGQVGFKDEYKAIAGKPIDQGSYLMQKRNILFNSVMPGDAAFYDVYDMVDEYYKSIGESNTFMNYMDKNTDKYKKSQAVYYYKSALKLGDAKAAEKYLAEYVLYGGTQKTLKDSMAYLDPTNALSAKKKADFLAWITPEQKATYDEAMKYYKELSEISSEIAFPAKTK